MKSLPKDLDNKKEKEQAKKSATKTIASPYFIPYKYPAITEQYVPGKIGITILTDLSRNNNSIENAILI